MAIQGWHREDIKALLRRRYGSVGRFEQSKGLPRASVSDVLRGRTAARTAAAIKEKLNKPDPAQFKGGKAPHESDLSDDNTDDRIGQPHPKNRILIVSPENI